MTNKQTTPILIAAALAFVVGSAAGKNVDLATLPPRVSVQLTIYNSEDLTLVREARSLTLKKGLNKIQYSWVNTLIDPTSVEIRPLEKADELDVLDTTFPHDRPQHLVWNIDSKIEGQVKFLVTYFTSGISWSADYVAIANPQETELTLDGYVRIVNNSGEDYEGAQVRLIVGTVNLVEKIQELARRGIPVPPPGAPIPAEMKQKLMQEAMKRAELPAGAAAPATRPPEIVKEGLSEYFIYTIDGEHSVPNGWAKRLLSFRARQVKFDILYRLRPHQYGPRPVRFFIFKNDPEHKMGTTPLPDGAYRAFRDNGKDGLSFLAGQQVRYIPIKQDIELNLGTDDEVLTDLTCTDVTRSNFRFNASSHVTGYDEARQFTENFRNFKGKDVRMEVRRQFPGDVDIEAESAKAFDIHTLEYTFDLKANTKKPYHFKTTQHCGSNAKQDRINLKGE